MRGTGILNGGTNCGLSMRLVYRGDNGIACWWVLAEVVIGMVVEQLRAKVLCEQIHKVDCCINPFQFKEILFDPFTNNVIFNVNVMHAGGWLLSHGNSHARVIVFIED